MSKRLFVLIAAALLAVMSILFVACTKEGEEKLTLSGFDVPAETEVSYGSIYTIPDYVVTDQNGNLYTVEVVVTNGEQTITPVGGQIDISLTTDYTVTFTVVLGEGETQQKKTTLKVVDGDAPRVTIGEMKTIYTVGEEITVPEAEVADNADTGLSAVFSVRSGGDTVLDKVEVSFTLDAAGEYELVASAKDAAGNEGTDSVAFVVREKANIGEIEDFADPYAAASVSPKANYGEILAGETAQIGGQSAFKINSKDTAGKITAYPGLSLAPRISLADAEALKEDGFTAITMNVYLEYSATRNIYHQWQFNNEGEHKQLNLGTVANNRWTTVSFSLDEFIAAYDDIASGEILFCYFGNDAEWTVDHVSADFNFYVKDIYITKEVTDTAISADLEEAYAQDAVVDISGITAASASEPEAGFDIVVTDPLGNEYTPADGTLTASAYGMYTVSARPDAHSKRFIAGAEITFSVYPDAETIEEMVESILAADDMGADEVIADAALLENWAGMLGQVEGADGLDMFRYYAAMTRTALEEDKLMYFDTALGREQVSTAFISDSDPKQNVESKDYIVLDTEETFGGKPTTRIGFDDVNGGAETWCCPFYFGFTLPGGDLAGYTHVRFYLNAHSYTEARPVEYALLYNGKRFVEPTVLPTGEWTEIRIDLAEEGITDLSKLEIAFYTKNGNDIWGSIWNSTDRYHVNITAAEGLIVVEDMALNSGFTYEETYDLGDTLDLSAFTATSAAYPDAPFAYTMEHNGQVQDLPESITFADSGWYTFTVSAAAPYLGEKSVQVYVNATDADPTVEYIEETVEVILAGDKADPDIVARAEAVRAWSAMLDDVYGSERLDLFRFYAAMHLTEIEEDTLVYFGELLGKEQVTAEYNTGSPVPTKDGISLDSSVPYNGEPTTKVEFTDVPTEWFGPYALRFAYTDKTADLGKYSHITFALRGYSYNSARPVTYFLRYNGTRFTDAVALGEEWTEVTIDLAEEGITDLSKLEVCFNTLNNGDEYGSLWNQVDRFYVHISTVKGIADIEYRDDKLIAFDEAAGKDAVSAEYDTGTAVPTKDGISLDSSVTYNEAPTTKIEFTDVPKEWFGPYVLKFSEVGEAADLTGYVSLSFALRGYSYNSARPVTYFLRYDGNRFTDPVALGEEWTEVTIDLAEEGITDLSKLEVCFNTLNGGDYYGSVWNEAGRFYAHISAVYGTKLAPVTIAAAEETCAQIVPRGYGTDKTDNSYVADFNGRSAVKAETNPETSSSNANSYKWPGVDIHPETSLAGLEWLKEQGYSKMVISMYIADTDAASIDVYYGPSGAKITSVTVGEWCDIVIPIDTVIAAFGTEAEGGLGNYFIYIDNGANGSYITFYISDITIEA